MFHVAALAPLCPNLTQWESPPEKVAISNVGCQDLVEFHSEAAHSPLPYSGQGKIHIPNFSNFKGEYFMLAYNLNYNNLKSNIGKF